MLVKINEKGKMQSMAANAALAGVFFAQVRRLSAALPAELRNPDRLMATLREKPLPLRFPISQSLTTQSADAHETLAQQLRGLEARNSGQKMIFFFILRIAMVAMAWGNYSSLSVMLLGALQFYLLPLSLSVSFLSLLLILPPLLLPHAIVASSAFMLQRLGVPMLSLQISNEFIVAFMLLDFASSFATAFVTPNGPTKWLGWRRTMQSIGYGALNAHSAS